MTDYDPEPAFRVNFTDPRVRRLAEAKWRLETGGTRMGWLVLGENNPEALIGEARDWLRAAVAAGIVSPPGGEDGLDLTNMSNGA